MNMRNMYNLLKIIVRVGIGVFFIVSAILKLLSIDTFELYIYSFNILSFPLSGLAARVVITCELLAGILLIIKVKYREAWWLTMLMLVGFSLLLLYVLFFRDDTNCHCMGDLVELKPSFSLVKNVVTMLLLWFVKNEGDYMFKWRKWALAGAFVAALVPPFVLFPTDNVYNFFRSDKLDYNEAAFNGLMADSSMQEVRIEQGNYIIGVISSGCPHCKVSCLKMSEIVEKNDLDESRVLYLVWGDSTSVEQFKADSKTESFRYIQINPIVAIHVANGTFPTYLFVKDGNVEKTADIKKLTEKLICEYLR